MTQPDFSHCRHCSNAKLYKQENPHVWTWLQMQSSNGTMAPEECEIDHADMATKWNLSCCATRQQASCAAVWGELRCCDSLADPSKAALADMVQRVHLHGVVGHVLLLRAKWSRDEVPAAPPDRQGRVHLCQAVVVPVPRSQLHTSNPVGQWLSRVCLMQGRNSVSVHAYLS